MLRPIAFALCLLSIVLPASRPAVGAEACRLQKYAELPVQWVADDPLVQALVGDRTVKMELDTNLVLSIIDTKLAESAHARIRPAPVIINIGNKVFDRYGIVPVTLGHLRYPGMDALIADQTKAARDQGVDGALGMDALMGPEIDLELDLGHDRIALYSSHHCPGMGPYWAKRYEQVPLRQGPLRQYYLVMSLDGKKIETVLSTAVRDNVLLANVSKPVFGFDQSSPDIQSETSQYGVRHYFRAMKLSAEGLIITNARVGLSSAGCSGIGIDRDGAVSYTTCGGVFPLELGNGVLRKLRLYLSPREGVMYLTLANVTGDSDVAPSSAPRSSAPH